MTFISPMQANAVNPTDDKFDRYKNYWMEPKLDGWRCIAVREGSSIELYSRTGHLFTKKVPHIVAELRKLPGDWMIDGELGYVDKMMELRWPIFDYNMTARVLGSDVDVALAKQREVWNQYQLQMEFFVFDMPSIEDALDWRANVLLGSLDTYDVAYPVRYIWGKESWDELLYNKYVEAGGEGVMLKDPDSHYHFGKRPAHKWMKVKKFETVSALITGYIEGQGKYSHLIGAINFVSQDGVPGKCSGMDDSTREFITENMESLIDCHIEVKHYGAMVDGYRHPQFQRFRQDLDG